MWARLVVGSMRGLRGEGRWRGLVAASVYTVAESNMQHWRDHINRTPLHRHVHTVSRRWLVDWLMYMWWEVDVPTSIVYDSAALFGYLLQLLRDNLMHNTMSLPHAVSEMALAAERTPDIEIILKRMLGDNWLGWMLNERTAGGDTLQHAASGSGEWKCLHHEVDESVAVDSSLYNQRILAEVMDADGSASMADQVRACFVRRIVETYIARIREVWTALPHRLLDPPEGKLDADDRLENNSV